ncbi:plasmid replication initiator protein (plasmid) [Sphingomonas panacis]|uniref:Plasmid replication initiator protein n=1 Tax=Sphingomonas panacis TaxID=1560345 RepID=A0A1B3ZI97_9SPHN|nr:replication initiator protein A [Sphingomonas panacis]AOH87151.1 plasmid replication initiator protein [Sphingomonas panacis]
MTKAKQSQISEQFDLFLPYISDLPLRDQREMMERPFFSLSKSKRIKPIDYNSPDGKLWVHVSANPDYGMATIWDADILIYCASTLADMARRGVNDVPRKLHLMPYDLLRAIGRPTTGRAYELLAQSLDRLVSTTVKTNIRAENRREATFSWLDGWTQLVDEKTERSRGMTIELSNWFHEGVLMQGGILSIDRAYFDISGGRERWLYKVARKHAGGAGEAGFAISLPTLFEKSGAEGQYRRFKFEIAKIAERNELPGYSVTIEQVPGKREPSLRMRRRAEADIEHSTRPQKGQGPRRSEPKPKGDAKTSAERRSAIPARAQDSGSTGTYDVRSLVRRTVSSLSSKATEGFITDATLQTLRSECPGWDYQNLHMLFREWIDGDPSRTPVNYQNAFLGFVRKYDKANRHTLRG